MRLKEIVEDGIDIFVLEGEIDLHYAPVLRSLLQGKIAERCPALVLDLSRVSFIDSSGLAAIIEYFRDAADHAGVLCLAGMNDSLQTIFEIVRLDKVIPIFANTAEAKAALAEGGVKPPGPALFDRSAA
ncbi:MAG: STAS domain-containing protein [Chthoniobacterales bacterium]